MYEQCFLNNNEKTTRKKTFFPLTTPDSSVPISKRSITAGDTWPYGQVLLHAPQSSPPPSHPPQVDVAETDSEREKFSADISGGKSPWQETLAGSRARARSSAYAVDTTAGNIWEGGREGGEEKRQRQGRRKEGRERGEKEKSFTIWATLMFFREMSPNYVN